MPTTPLAPATFLERMTRIFGPPSNVGRNLSQRILPNVTPNQPPVNPQLAGAVQGAYTPRPRPAQTPAFQKPVAPAPAAPAPAAPGMMTYDQAKAQYGVQRARQMQAAGQVSG